MEAQLHRAISESVDLIQSLLRQLEQDRDAMPRCVSGEILEEYLKATDLAESRINDIKRRLLQLQAEQRQFESGM